MCSKYCEAPSEKGGIREVKKVAVRYLKTHQNTEICWEDKVRGGEIEH